MSCFLVFFAVIVFLFVSFESSIGFLLFSNFLSKEELFVFCGDSDETLRFALGFNFPVIMKGLKISSV